MPRLKLPAEIKRSCYVLCTLTPDEKQQLEKIKQQTGKSFSSILRDAFISTFRSST